MAIASSVDVSIIPHDENMGKMSFTRVEVFTITLTVVRGNPSYPSYGSRSIVGSKPLGLAFIEVKSHNQVLLSGAEDIDSHEVDSRIRCLASPQSMKDSAPCRKRASRASKMSRCHWGDGKSTSLRQRSSQIHSKARSFSSTVI